MKFHPMPPIERVRQVLSYYNSETGEMEYPVAQPPPQSAQPVAELMRLVDEFARLKVDRASWGVVSDENTNAARTAIETFAHAAQPVEVQPVPLTRAEVDAIRTAWKNQPGDRMLGDLILATQDAVLAKQGGIKPTSSEGGA